MPRIDHGAVVAADHALARSPHWHSVETAFRASHAKCVGCGATDVGLQVHHRFAFHECCLSGRPDLELDPRNLVVLCEHEHARPAANCHLTKGHLDDFRSWNPDLAHCLEAFYGLDEATCKANAAWLELRAARPKPWGEWPAEERAAFRARLDAELPPDPAVLARYAITL